MGCSAVVVILTGMVAGNDLPPQPPTGGEIIVESPAILRIHVAGLPRTQQQIFGEHLVQPDGNISLGIYGNIDVSGHTVDEVRRRLEQHLRPFSRSTQFRVRALITSTTIKPYYVCVPDKDGKQVYR